MISPPDARSRDEGALEETGRERYLNSLERRLGKLEGGGGKRRQLTSRDILQSLSEARDGYITQQSGMGTETGGYRNGPASRRSGATGRSGGRVPSSAGSGSGRESPFSIKNEFADVDLGGGGESVVVVRGGSGGGGGEGEVRGGGGGGGEVRGGGGGGEWGRRVAEGGGEERPVTSGSIWTCCFQCKGGRHRVGYSRAGRGTDEEDRSNLVEYDELSLEWQSQDINDIT